MPIRTFLLSALAASVVIAVLAPAAYACPSERSQNRAAAINGMMCLLNQERTKRGIAPVRWDGRLARVAKRHAGDMVSFSFTGHNSPARGGLLARVKRARAASRHRQFWVGENLGWGGTPLAVHRAWMRSAIHKKATLYRKFRRVGVGVVRGLPNGSKYSGLTYVVTYAG